MKILRRVLFLFALSISLCHASDYPSRPIHILVPYGPGGAADVISRIFADHMSKTLNQSIVIVNRPGGNANIAPAAVAVADPDGYTLLSSSVAFAVNPYIESNLNWDVSDFVPVAKLVESSNLFVVPSQLGPKTLDEFVRFAKATPHLPTNVSSLGNSQALAREYFAHAAGIKFTDIGYKGGVTWIADLVNGSLVFSSAPINPILSLIQSGQLRVLASTGPARTPLFPDVPTVGELGYPDATSVSWFGFHAPKGTPLEVIDTLDQAARAASQDEEVRKRVEAAGAVMAYLGSTEFDAFMQREVGRAKTFASIVQKEHMVAVKH